MTLGVPTPRAFTDAIIDVDHLKGERSVEFASHSLCAGLQGESSV